MVSGFVVMTVGIMLRGLTKMLSRILMMVPCVGVVLRGFLGHGVSPGRCS
jgi:hypothetical protein